jgi:hypothetical protein
MECRRSGRKRKLRRRFADDEDDEPVLVVTRTRTPVPTPISLPTTSATATATSSSRPSVSSRSSKVKRLRCPKCDLSWEYKVTLPLEEESKEARRETLSLLCYARSKQANHYKVHHCSVTMNDVMTSPEGREFYKCVYPKCDYQTFVPKSGRRCDALSSLSRHILKLHEVNTEESDVEEDEQDAAANDGGGASKERLIIEEKPAPPEPAAPLEVDLPKHFKPAPTVKDEVGVEGSSLEEETGEKEESLLVEGRDYLRCLHPSGCSYVSDLKWKDTKQLYSVFPGAMWRLSTHSLRVHDFPGISLNKNKPSPCYVDDKDRGGGYQCPRCDYFTLVDQISSLDSNGKAERRRSYQRFTAHYWTHLGHNAAEFYAKIRAETESSSQEQEKKSEETVVDAKKDVVVRPNPKPKPSLKPSKSSTAAGKVSKKKKPRKRPSGMDLPSKLKRMLQRSKPNNVPPPARVSTSGTRTPIPLDSPAGPNKKIIIGRQFRRLSDFDISADTNTSRSQQNCSNSKDEHQSQPNTVAGGGGGTANPTPKPMRGRPSKRSSSFFSRVTRVRCPLCEHVELKTSPWKITYPSDNFWKFQSKMQQHYKAQHPGQVFTDLEAKYCDEDYDPTTGKNDDEQKVSIEG